MNQPLRSVWKVGKAEETERDADISVSEVIVISDDEDLQPNVSKKKQKSKIGLTRAMVQGGRVRKTKPSKRELPSSPPIPSRVLSAPNVKREISPSVSSRPCPIPSHRATKTSVSKQERQPNIKTDGKRTANTSVRPVNTPKHAGSMKPPLAPILASATSVPKPKIGTPRLPSSSGAIEDELVYPKEEVFTPLPVSMEVNSPPLVQATSRTKKIPKLESQSGSLQPGFSVKSQETNTTSIKRKVEEDVADDEIDEEDVQNTLATAAKLMVCVDNNCASSFYLSKDLL